MRAGLDGGIRAMLVAGGILGLLASGAAAQQCDELWEVDKSALSKAFTNIDSYLTGPEPVVINLKELGATSGQLVIVFAKKNLRCARQIYETKLTGPGTIKICKRPRC